MKRFALAASVLALGACAHADHNTVSATETVAPEAEVVETVVETVEAVAAVVEPLAIEDVTAAQVAWGEGIVAISAVHAAGGDYEARAREHIDTLYAYGESPVMFKPTLAADDQFRETFDEALAYFIGKEGTEDSGFAISGWTNVRWEDVLTYTDSDSAMSMGNYFFTGPDGSETKVEFSFGYMVDEEGDLKINLHHSSLPYAPE